MTGRERVTSLLVIARAASRDAIACLRALAASRVMKYLRECGITLSNCSNDPFLLARTVNNWQRRPLWGVSPGDGENAIRWP